MVAVFGSSTWTPKGAGKAATRLCRDVVRRPPGLVLCSMYTTLLAGRSPLHLFEEMKTMAGS